MKLQVTVELLADSYDPSQSGVDQGNHVTLNHDLVFNMQGDNLNGPSMGVLEEKFFTLARLIRSIML